MAIDKEASRIWRRRIRDVLNSEWDPIGVSTLSPDEYDAYAAKVAAMIRSGASDNDLSAYLHWAETEHIGMPGNRDRLEKVVGALREIGFIN